MKRFRAVLAIAVAIGALALSGCASDPDVGGLESGLSEIDGVSGTLAYTTHSGGPWNTQVVVLLFVDDPSDEAVVATARAAAPVLAGDPASSGREVAVYFIDGVPADYERRSAAFADAVPMTPALIEALGVSRPGSAALRLSPDDVRRLADGS
jgi:hypothetical protein